MLCDKRHRPWVAPSLSIAAKEADMLSPIILALGAFYTVFGVVIVRRAYKPTCRVCLFRQFCPNRQSGHLQFAGKPCWSRRDH